MGAAVIITMSVVLLLIKGFQLFSLQLCYFDDPTSVVEPVLYIGAILFSATFSAPCLCVPSWQWQIGVGTVLLSWITLLLQMRRVPVTGLYIVMFFDIFYIFCKVVMLLAVLIIAFALSFYMIFYTPSEYVCSSGQEGGGGDYMYLIHTIVLVPSGCSSPIHTGLFPRL